MLSLKKMEEKEQKETELFFRNISYVTLKEGWEEVKGFFWAWLILSAIALGFSFLADTGIEKAERIWEDWPRELSVFVVFAVVTWFLRGTEIRMPASNRLWFYMVAIVGVMALASYLLPTWATVSVWFLLIVGIATLSELSRIGAKNYERLHEPPEEDDTEFDYE